MSVYVLIAIVVVVVQEREDIADDEREERPPRLLLYDRLSFPFSTPFYLRPARDVVRQKSERLFLSTPLSGTVPPFLFFGPKARNERTPQGAISGRESKGRSNSIPNELRSLIYLTAV